MEHLRDMIREINVYFSEIKWPPSQIKFPTQQIEILIPLLVQNGAAYQQFRNSKSHPFTFHVIGMRTNISTNIGMCMIKEGSALNVYSRTIHLFRYQAFDLVLTV